MRMLSVLQLICLVFVSGGQAKTLGADIEVYYLLNSTGEAAQSHSSRMGGYYPTGETIKDFPIFRRSVNFLYVNPIDHWMIGANISSRAGWFYHPDRNPTPAIPPLNGWKYAKDGAFHEDSSLTVTLIDRAKTPQVDDMILDQEQMDWLKSGLLHGELDGLIVNENTPKAPSISANALRDPNKLWPNRIVYYSFDATLKSLQQNTVRTTLSGLQDKLSSCLTFQEKNDGNRIIVGTSGKYFNSYVGGCWSQVGYKAQPQYLNLAIGCWGTGTIEHEFLHAIGIYHHQSRSDRDAYVNIITNNIIDGKKHNFNKYDQTRIFDHGLPYDYGSVMHYGKSYFAKIPGQITIETLDPTKQDVIGNRGGVTTGDIELVRRAYGCYNTLAMMAVGPTGWGKSSLLNSLLCPARLTNDFEDCHFETGDAAIGVTKDITYRTGLLLGDKITSGTDFIRKVKLYDTPGLGDPEGNDADTLKGIVGAIRAEGANIRTLLLVTKATEYRFNDGIQRELKTLEYILGPEMWDHVITAFTFWGFESGDVKKRKNKCKKENKLKFRGRMSDLKSHCQTLNFEEKKANDWASGYKQFLKVQKSIPYAFTHPVFDYNEPTEKDIFYQNALKIYDESAKMKVLTCDQNCQRRLEIALKNEEKTPVIIGEEKRYFEKGEGFLLRCHLYLGLANKTEKELKWFHNSTQMDINIENTIIETKIISDVTKESRLRIANSALSDSGSYECSTEENGIEKKSEIMEVNILKTWSDWSSCSKSCIQENSGVPGTKSRDRECAPPEYGEEWKSCETKETKECAGEGKEFTYCPVDGYWSTWSSWSSCRGTCREDGYGTKTRSRSCNPPRHGGDGCTGDDSEDTRCTTQDPCPDLTEMWREYTVFKFEG